uniref:Uncharacterized protein n=1 Tax=Acrobeloides nanus TaxID=290746 RepID=A0A914D398_9BILA
MLYHYVGKSRPNPVLQELVAAAAGCAEVAGVELELANGRKPDSAINETLTVSQAMIFPELLWPEKENSSISSDEATEAANQDDSHLLEVLRRPLSSARRSMISLTSRRSMVPEQTHCSMEPEFNMMNIDTIRKESRRHTSTPSTSQYLLIPFYFNEQMARGSRASCHLEPRTYL